MTFHESLEYSSVAPRINTDSKSGEYIPTTFPIGPFTKFVNNPILRPNPANGFESAYLYNPTAIVVDDKVFLLYRAQGPDKVSRIGLAWSEDGYNFTRLDKPILSPTEPWEQGGGCEDPRIVRVDGVFYLTYTGYDLDKAKLCLATSTDLLNWKKYPPLWPEFIESINSPEGDHAIRVNWSKAGAIIPEKNKDGKYIMFWGEGNIYSAESTDLINWKTNKFPHYFAQGVHPWETFLIEPGPAPFKTADGKWILIYNGAAIGDARYERRQYSVGQMLVDPNNLKHGPLARIEKPLLVPETKEEKVGQVGQVCFCEGAVQFKGQWFLYYGQADNELAVAVSPLYHEKA